jgi:hemolysin D
MTADRQLNPTIKILLVDDLRVVREKLKSILKPYRDLQIIGMATDGQNAIEQLEWLHPDIILLDLDMPRLDGVQTARIITEQYPHIKVIILSSSENLDNIGNFPNSCIKAYIVKGDLDREIVDKIRAVFEQENDDAIEAKSPTIDRDNIIEFNRSSQLTTPDSIAFEPEQSSSFHSNFSTNLATQFTAVTQTTLTKLDDWSSSAKELIDMMPLPWARGSLYLLLALVTVSIPWACLYKMDEIGIARGRLESKGNTIKREADIEGSVAVVKVFVKKGDIVKKGQIIMELDSKNVRAQLYQNQLKLDGAQQRLDRLLLMKNQVGLGTTAQQQQNQAQLLEKQSQIAQAQQSISTLETNSRNQIAEKLAQLRQAEQTLADRQSSYNLQKAEKLTQVRQAEQAVLDAQTNHLMAQNRLKDAQNEVRRYTKLYQTGAIAQVKTQEIASIALEKNQLFTQASATLQQSKLRVKEQQENYQKLLQQARSDIAQARLRLTEQQQIYQGTISRSQSDVAQAKLQLTEQQRSSQSLTKGGNIAILKTDQQLKEIESQIVSLNSEINRDRAQSTFLSSQIEKYTIEANTNGTIFELPIDREGAVVQPKQLIAEIASNTSGLVFKGEIPATQSESLRSSLDANISSNIQKEVRLKFDEFPFESYDVVKGKLTWVAPNSKLTAVQSGGSLASYDIEVQLGQSCIKYESNCIPFKSGQPATAEIVIRNRRIIDFILDPFKKLTNGNR